LVPGETNRLPVGIVTKQDKQIATSRPPDSACFTEKMEKKLG